MTLTFAPNILHVDANADADADTDAEADADARGTKVQAR